MHCTCQEINLLKEQSFSLTSSRSPFLTVSSWEFRAWKSHMACMSWGGLEALKRKQNCSWEQNSGRWAACSSFFLVYVKDSLEKDLLPCSLHGHIPCDGTSTRFCKCGPNTSAGVGLYRIWVAWLPFPKGITPGSWEYYGALMPQNSSSNRVPIDRTLFLHLCQFQRSNHVNLF